MLLFASANRDSTIFHSPNKFDIKREKNEHLGFGHGIHMCVGKHLAILEISKLLAALLDKVERIEAKRPKIYLNNTINRLESLEVKFIPLK